MRNTLFSHFEPRGKIGGDTKRMRYVDIAFFIGIILVIFGHSHPLDSSWWHTWYRDSNEFIYTFHMQLFFFVGGYLTVHSKGIDKIGYSKWASSKLWKFLVPYFVLTFIAFVPKALLGDTSDVVNLSFNYIFYNTFINPRVGIWGHFWYIPAFLFLDLIWGIWRAKSPNNKDIYKQGLIIGLLFSLALGCYPIRTDMYVLYDISQQAIFFALGVLLAVAKPILWDKAWKNLLALPICGTIVYFLYKHGHYQYDPTPVINVIVGLALVWIVWSISVLLSKFSFMSFTEKLTKYSFNIYVYSWPAQAAADAVLRRMGVNWLAIVGILFVIGLIAPLIIVKIYTSLKFLHCKFFDYLIGVQTQK